MAALAVLGLAACAAEPPPPPPPPERPSIQNRRRPVVRRNHVPVRPAPRPQEEVPAEASTRPPEAPADRPSEEAAARTRQERDQRAFVACHERGTGGGQAVAACLQGYNSTGVVPGN